MIDFARLTTSDKKLISIQKGIKFLDHMVKMVFYSTFIFTIVVVTIAYIKDWEMVMNTISERWYTVMIGELVVTGIIKSVKEITEVLIGWLERREDKEYEKQNNS